MTKPVGAVGSSFVYETPKGLNGPTGAVPELPVTAEMIAAGVAASKEVPSIDWNDLAPAIYRAMAAKAPDRLPPVFMGTYGALTNIRPEPGCFVPCTLDEARARIGSFEPGGSQAPGNMFAGVKEFIADEKLLLECRALLAGKDQRIAELEAELASLRSAFSDPAPADLPDPPRRPDGTLAPQPKPWTPPKQSEPQRRVGG
jgi:hypothetical protein